MVDTTQKIERFAQLIADSKNIVVLTGAGMSTESGIQDFRSPGTGLWNKLDPYEFGSIDSYVSNTQNMFEPLLDLGLTIFKAKANKGHKALTKLQKMGKLEGIMTQNIDRLHQKARSKNVLELHGNVMEAMCMKCNKIFPITNLVNKVLKKQPIECDKCRGMLKPNAIFFGEALDSEVLTRADEMVENCDLLMVLGSSLVVYPVAFYPHKALSHGAKLAIINLQKTDMDKRAEVVIHQKIGDVLPEIVQRAKEKMHEFSP
jgi:NAD-dependent deacetylase